ncbi:hypothetical protein Btru_070993 [Bulinus truncatus]|nr:hypothetical protein Btru_070993 [Bulinus truncatus]
MAVNDKAVVEKCNENGDLVLVSSCLSSLEQIIDWLNVLVDSHFQQFRLADDAADAVNSLYEQVLVIACCQLESLSLQGSLAELNRLFEEKQKNLKMGVYCILVISF